MKCTVYSEQQHSLYGIGNRKDSSGKVLKKVFQSSAKFWSLFQTIVQLAHTSGDNELRTFEEGKKTV